MFPSLDTWKPCNCSHVDEKTLQLCLPRLTNRAISKKGRSILTFHPKTHSLPLQHMCAAVSTTLFTCMSLPVMDLDKFSSSDNAKRTHRQTWTTFSTCRDVFSAPVVLFNMFVGEPVQIEFGVAISIKLCDSTDVFPDSHNTTYTSIIINASRGQNFSRDTRCASQELRQTNYTNMARRVASSITKSQTCMCEEFGSFRRRLVPTMY